MSLTMSQERWLYPDIPNHVTSLLAVSWYSLPCHKTVDFILISLTMSRNFWLYPDISNHVTKLLAVSWYPRPCHKTARCILIYLTMSQDCLLYPHFPNHVTRQLWLYLLSPNHVMKSVAVSWYHPHSCHKTAGRILVSPTMSHTYVLYPVIHNQVTRLLAVS
jgi:hypothetical protein